MVKMISQERDFGATHDYRDLMLMKQNIEGVVSKKTQIGEKRPQDEILSEVMSEIETLEKAFKFDKDMKICALICALISSAT